MIKFQEIINKNVSGILATKNGDGVDTRYFQALWAEGNRAYFCTSGKKEVYSQLVKNPEVSFCAENGQSPVLTLNGEVKFIEGLEEKQKAFKVLPMLEKIYQSPENPDFKVFYIEVKEVKTFSFTEGTKRYSI